MMGHNFSRQITEKCGTKYENGNYILGHPKWKWELYFGTEGVYSFLVTLLDNNMASYLGDCIYIYI